MKRILALLVLCCALPGLTVSGAEAKAPPKEERAPEGATGTITGTLVKKEHGRITVKNETQQLQLMPYWHGGLPAAGGGYDKAMLQQIEALKIGAKVKVDWKFSEHYRIAQITRVD